MTFSLTIVNSGMDFEWEHEMCTTPPGLVISASEQPSTTSNHLPDTQVQQQDIL